MTGVCGCSAVPVLVAIGIGCDGSSAMPSRGASLPLAGVSLPPGMLPGSALLGSPLGGAAPAFVPLAAEPDPEKAGTSAFDSRLDVPHAAASTSEREMA